VGGEEEEEGLGGGGGGVGDCRDISLTSLLTVCNEYACIHVCIGICVSLYSRMNRDLHTSRLHIADIQVFGFIVKDATVTIHTIARGHNTQFCYVFSLLLSGMSTKNVHFVSSERLVRKFSSCPRIQR